MHRQAHRQTYRETVDCRQTSKERQEETGQEKIQ